MSTNCTKKEGNERIQNPANMANTMTKAVIEVERKFALTDESEEKILRSGAVLKSQKTFKDIYYDTTDHRLTLADHWLRERDGKWELKCPPPNSAVTDGKSTSYSEYNKECEIIELMGKILQVEDRTLSTIPSILKHANCEGFASFVTERKSYALDDFSIDLDEADFGFRVGEIELMVAGENEIEGAQKAVDELADRLGFQVAQRMPGKMDAYLMKNNREHYLCLLNAHILAAKLPDEWPTT